MCAGGCGLVRRMGVLAAMVVMMALLVVAGVHNLRQRRAAMAQARAAQIVLVKDGAAPVVDDGVENSGTSLMGKAAPGISYHARWYSRRRHTPPDIWSSRFRLSWRRRCPAWHTRRSL